MLDTVFRSRDAFESYVNAEHIDLKAYLGNIPSEPFIENIIYEGFIEYVFSIIKYPKHQMMQSIDQMDQNMQSFIKYVEKVEDGSLKLKGKHIYKKLSVFIPRYLYGLQTLILS